MCFWPWISSKRISQCACKHQGPPILERMQGAASHTMSSEVFPSRCLNSSERSRCNSARDSGHLQPESAIKMAAESEITRRTAALWLQHLR